MLLPATKIDCNYSFIFNDKENVSSLNINVSIQQCNVTQHSNQKEKTSRSCLISREILRLYLEVQRPSLPQEHS